MATNAVSLTGWDAEFNGLVLDTEIKGQISSIAGAVKVSGAAYRDNGVMVMPGTLITSTGDDVYVKWSPNGKGLHARFFALLVPSGGGSTAGEIVSEGFDAMAFTTNHSYLSSTVVKDDVSYFTRMHFDPIKKSVTYSTATNNYDDQGGTVIQTKTIGYNTTSKYDTALWDSYKSNGLGFGFGVFDNYAGTSASVTLHEVITKSNEVVIEATNQTLFDAAVNLAARAYSDAHLADLEKVSKVNQLTAGWSPIQASDLGMTASLTESFSIIDGNLLRYSNGGFSASVGVTILDGVRTLGISFEGTNTSISFNSLNDMASDLVLIDSAYLQGKSFATKVAKYAADNKFDQVLVSGHSLGGAMAQIFMSQFGINDTRYIGITFGSPGVEFVSNIPMERFVNFANTNDPVPKAGALRSYDTSGATVKIKTEDAGGLLGINNHSIFELSPTQVSYNNAISYLGTQFNQRDFFHDMIVGTKNADSISSNSISTRLALSYSAPVYGLDGFDSLLGDSRKNFFSGGSGGDYIDGGDNIDTAQYSAPRQYYSLINQPFGHEVRSLSASDGIDTLVNIERLQFLDKKVALDLKMDESAGKTALFLGVVAYPLQYNLGVFGSVLSYFDQGISLKQLAQAVINAGIVHGLAGSSSNLDLAKLAYRNVIGSEAPDAVAKSLASLMIGSGGGMSQADFIATVAQLDVNQQHVNLVGLQTTGVEYL